MNTINKQSKDKIMKRILDMGNYFEDPLDAVTKAIEILNKFGIFTSELDVKRTEDSDCGDGRVSYSLFDEDCREYENVLVITYHMMDVSGRYEVIMYIS